MKNHKKIMKTTKDTGTDKNSREYMVFLYGFFWGGGGPDPSDEGGQG